MKVFDLFFEQTLDEPMLLNHGKPLEGFAGNLKVIKFPASP